MRWWFWLPVALLAGWTDAQTLTARVVTRAPDACVKVYEHRGTSQRTERTMTCTDYQSLNQRGSREPTRPVDLPEQAHRWQLAYRWPQYITASGSLEAGDIDASVAAVLVIRLPDDREVSLPTSLYTLTTTPAIAVTPDPPGFTVEDGVITIVDLGAIPR
jgi:hypothetical protein